MLKKTEIVSLIGGYRLVAKDGSLNLDFSETEVQDLVLSIFSQTGIELKDLNYDTKRWLSKRINELEAHEADNN
jgi:hypothetical protein